MAVFSIERSDVSDLGQMMEISISWIRHEQLSQKQDSKIGKNANTLLQTRWGFGIIIHDFYIFYRAIGGENYAERKLAEN